MAITSAIQSYFMGKTFSITHILWVKTFSHTPFGVTKFAGKHFFGPEEAHSSERKLV